MKRIFSKVILSAILVGCVMLVGCGDSNNETSPSPSDSAAVTSEQGTTSTVTGTWSAATTSGDAYQYLTFEDGELVYGEYDADGETVSLSRAIGTYTENSDGTATVTVKNGSVSETYTASVESGSLSIELASNASANDSYSLSGTYSQADKPADYTVVSSSPASSASASDASPSSSVSPSSSPSPSSSASPSSSSSAGNSDMASFLSGSTFSAGTDTYLGNAHEGQVTGSFSVSETDGKIQGTFSVTVEGSSAGSLSITIEGNKMYATNSAFGTSGEFTIKTTSSSVIITQTTSDGEGEDLLETIEGTWTVK